MTSVDRGHQHGALDNGGSTLSPLLASVFNAEFSISSMATDTASGSRCLQSSHYFYPWGWLSLEGARPSLGRPSLSERTSHQRKPSVVAERLKRAPCRRDCGSESKSAFAAFRPIAVLPLPTISRLTCQAACRMSATVQRRLFPVSLRALHPHTGC